ncbi:hypothetical protein LWI29_037935 [Acer saccharum]|uniref:CCHC-type domain-containing protein n=1 Tax=Acer saccharum TaxID=4024 RepID=A0AA39W683_ACESA|nr:hypothetical protein LWI29_037935 [Acer saccharum]
MLGTAIKVDPITESQARGRFARICVEIDITKPLRSSLAVEDRDIKVEYENLGLICFKCGRVGHNWESCKESTVEKSEECKEAGEQIASPKLGYNDKIAERDSYGSWMQVSYGRSYRNQFGYSPVGKKNGNQGNGGRQGFGDRQENRSGQASVGVGKPGTFVVKKGADTGKNSMKVTPLKNNGKSVSKSLGGSRFSILSDNMEEEINIENRQSMASSSRVLTEISNRVLPTKKQLTPNAYKYLIEPPSVKSSLSKSSKENGTEVRTKKSGKETKKNRLHSFSIQPKSLEEDIEDSEAL